MAEPLDRGRGRKLQVALLVLGGVVSAKEAARRSGVAEQAVHDWMRAFLVAGRESLAQGRRRRSRREVELETKNKELEAAPGEVYVQLRVWKKGAECLPASRTSR